MSHRTRNEDDYSNPSKLRKDASNFKAHGFKLNMALRAANCEAVMKIKIRDPVTPGAESKVIEVDTLSTDLHKSRIAGLTLNEYTALNPEPSTPTRKKEWNQLQKLAVSKICNSVDDEWIYVLQGSPPIAPILRSKIKEHFDPSDSVSISHLYRKLQKISVNNYGNFEEYASDLMLTARKLRENGENVTERYQLNCLLEGLQPEKDYSVVKSLIQDKDQISLSQAIKKIKDSLRNNNRKITKQGGSNLETPTGEETLQTAVMMLLKKQGITRIPTKRGYSNTRTSKWSDQKKKKKRKFKKGIVCFVCNKEGHYKSDCWHNKKNKKLNKIHTQEDIKGKQYLMTLKRKTPSPPKEQKDKILLDSGASAHYFKNKAFFIALQHTKPIKILVGNGEGITAKMRGSVKILLSNETETREILLEALYCPSLQTNVLSTTAILRKGYKVTMKGNELQISKGNKEILRGTTHKDGLMYITGRYRPGGEGREGGRRAGNGIQGGTQKAPAREAEKEARLGNGGKGRVGGRRAGYGTQIGTQKIPARKAEKGARPEKNLELRQENPEKDPRKRPAGDGTHTGTQEKPARRAEKKLRFGNVLQHGHTEAEKDPRKTVTSHGHVPNGGTPPPPTSPRAPEAAEGGTRKMRHYAYHCRLGHIGSKKIRETIKSTVGIKLKSYPNKVPCVACDETKTKRAEINKNVGRQVENHKTRKEGTKKGPWNYPDGRKLWERVHSDVKELTRSINGYQYFVILIHEGTRWSQVTPMKKKNEVSLITKEYLKRMQKIPRFGVVREFRSDGGGEYRNKELEEYLKKEGIAISLSVARTPEQNSISERGIQTIMSKTRPMLRHADLPTTYWEYAVKVSEYLTNRTTHEALKDKTPYEMLFGTKPNIEKLTTFGCIGVISVDKQIRSDKKLSLRGKYVRMLGYDIRHGNFIVSTKTRKITRARITTWYEHLFKFPVINRTSVPSPANSFSTATTPAGFDYLEDSDEGKQAIANDSDLKEDSKNACPRVSSRTNRGVPPPRAGFLATITHKLDKTNNSKFPAQPRTVVSKEVKTYSLADIQDIPRDYDDAISRPDALYWQQSIEEELENLTRNGTYSLVSRPTGRNVIKPKWVFKKKMQENGKLRYKSRLVARGYTQQYGSDYFFSFAPTLSQNSFRILLAFASLKKYKIRSIDIVSAYLYGKLEEECYLDIPPGWRPRNNIESQLLASNINVALKLHKGLYGLHQAGNIWAKTLTTFLQRIGFRQLQTDPCVFNHKNKNLILSVYVDDINILYVTDNELFWLLDKIRNTYKFRDEGPLTKTLGFEITRDNRGNYTLSQRDYINLLAQRFRLTPGAKPTTPLVPGHKLHEHSNEDKVNPKAYREMIGTAMYLACATRPDIAHALSFLARFSQNPKLSHYKCLKKLLQFVVNTRKRTIKYDGSTNILQAYADASFNSDPTTSKSHSGCYIEMCGGPITWRNKRQTIVAPSTAEAEYISLSACTREVIFVRQLLYELKLPIKKPTTIHCDSKSAISIGTKPSFSQKSKSIRLHYHITRSEIGKSIVLKYIQGKDNPADILTKPVPSAVHNKHSNKMFKISNVKGEEQPVHKKNKDAHAY